jgi:ABC-type enterochelin transport system permease subunit
VVTLLLLVAGVALMTAWATTVVGPIALLVVGALCVALAAVRDHYKTKATAEAVKR